MNKDEIVARFQLYKHYIPIIMSIDRDLCNLVSKNSFVTILTLECSVFEKIRLASLGSNFLCM